MVLLSSGVVRFLQGLFDHHDGPKRNLYLFQRVWVEAKTNILIKFRDSNYKITINRIYLKFYVTKIAHSFPRYQFIHWYSCWRRVQIHHSIPGRVPVDCWESWWTASFRWIQITFIVTGYMVIISNACYLRSAIILTRTMRWDVTAMAAIGSFSWLLFAISIGHKQIIS